MSPLSCVSIHLLNAHLAELSESSVILVLPFELTLEFLQLHLVPVLNAHLAELYRIHNRILSATVSLIHSLASKVFSNLEVFS
jgi:hypothetical protein